MSPSFPLRSPRVAAVAAHLVLSALVCGLCGWVALRWLYPGTYARMAGGTQLFWMIFAVDVTIGPLLTFVVFDTKKPRADLVRDLAVIAALQCAALAYGAYTLYAARPVALVFEVDRFRLLSPVAILESELPEAPPAFRTLPRGEVWMLGARRAADGGQERLQAIELALSGYDLAQRPSYWRDYAELKSLALSASRPVDGLVRMQPDARAQVDELAAQARFDPALARFLPVAAHRGEWVAILSPAGDIAGFIPFDGF